MAGWVSNASRHWVLFYSSFAARMAAVYISNPPPRDVHCYKYLTGTCSEGDTDGIIKNIRSTTINIIKTCKER